MVQAKTKDIAIGDRTYQIGRFSALDGSWVLAQLLTKMMPAMIEGAFRGAGAKLPKERASLSEDEFKSIQAHALGVCRRYNQHGLPEPVFAKGKFAIPDLEDDLVTVAGLTVHSLLFNISSFFQGGGLAQLLGSFNLDSLGLNSSNPQT